MFVKSHKSVHIKSCQHSSKDDLSPPTNLFHHCVCLCTCVCAHTYLQTENLNRDCAKWGLFLGFRFKVRIEFSLVWLKISILDSIVLGLINNYCLSSSGSLCPVCSIESDPRKRGCGLQLAQWHCRTRRTWASTRTSTKMKSSTNCRQRSWNSWRQPWRRLTLRSGWEDWRSSRSERLYRRTVAVTLMHSRGPRLFATVMYILFSCRFLYKPIFNPQNSRSKHFLGVANNWTW